MAYTHTQKICFCSEERHCLLFQASSLSSEEYGNRISLVSQNIWIVRNEMKIEMKIKLYY